MIVSPHCNYHLMALGYKIRAPSIDLKGEKGIEMKKSRRLSLKDPSASYPYPLP